MCAAPFELSGFVNTILNLWRSLSTAKTTHTNFKRFVPTNVDGF